MAVSRTEALLSPQALRAVNAHYEPLGLRVCRVCQGAPLPLTSEYFYPAASNRYGLTTSCKRCHNANCAARAKRRYHADAAYRQHLVERQRAYRRQHAGTYLATTRRMIDQRKRGEFARILKGVKP